MITAYHCMMHDASWYTTRSQWHVWSCLSVSMFWDPLRYQRQHNRSRTPSFILQNLQLESQVGHHLDTQTARHFKILQVSRLNLSSQAAQSPLGWYTHTVISLLKPQRELWSTHSRDLVVICRSCKFTHALVKIWTISNSGPFASKALNLTKS